MQEPSSRWHEWVFSGIGVAILLALAKLVQWLWQRRKSLNATMLPPTMPPPVQPAAILPPAITSPDVTQDIPEQPDQPVDNPPVQQEIPIPDPNRLTLEHVLEAFEDRVSKERIKLFLGVSIDWEVTFQAVVSTDGEKVSLMLTPTESILESSGVTIFCTVKIKSCPFIRTTRQGSRLRVRGKICEFQHKSISLSRASISVPK
jgi:hypothetical protein